jgi:hypothetical protein
MQSYILNGGNFFYFHHDCHGHERVKIAIWLAQFQGLNLSKVMDCVTTHSHQRPTAVNYTVVCQSPKNFWPRELIFILSK